MFENHHLWTCFNTLSLLATYGNQPHYFIIYYAAVSLSYSDSKEFLFFSPGTANPFLKQER